MLSFASCDIFNLFFGLFMTFVLEKKKKEETFVKGEDGKQRSRPKGVHYVTIRVRTLKTVLGEAILCW